MIFFSQKRGAGLHHDTLASSTLIGRAETGEIIACGYVPCSSQPPAREELCEAVLPKSPAAGRRGFPAVTTGESALNEQSGIIFGILESLSWGNLCCFASI